MNIDQIIFNILNKSAHTWVRYWKQEEILGMSLPGEYIEIRSHFITDTKITEILEAGFKIKSISSKQIGADSYCDVVLMRKI